MSKLDFLSPGLQFGLEHISTAGWVVIGLLLLLSVCAWAALLAKLFLIRRAQSANLMFLRAFRESGHPLALFQKDEHYERSPLDLIYHDACREMAWHLVGVDEPGESFAARLQGAGRVTPSQMSAVQTVMERDVAQAALRLESHLGMASAAVNAAPYLGLLGTIWGILDAFTALVKQGGELGIFALAPGVSAALITTLVGLIVALPGMVAFNYIVSRVRGMIVRLDNFAAELSVALDRAFVDHRFTAEPLPSLGAFGSPSMPAFGGGAASVTAPVPAAR
ncbi:MAG: MotA/TolQ/ExbB proton channel family protein [Verrucomicrobiaceae bacterium]|nr:MotA/TolQ/ExbB proton channel family protein [Verrucomicrobiaceae bacterium]